MDALNRGRQTRRQCSHCESFKLYCDLSQAFTWTGTQAGSLSEVSARSRYFVSLLCYNDHRTRPLQRWTAQYQAGPSNVVIKSSRCVMPLPGRKGSLTCNGYFPFEKNIQANIQAIDVLRLLWKSSLLRFVVIVVRDDSQDNGCCSSMLLHPTMLSTYSEWRRQPP